MPTDFCGVWDGAKALPNTFLELPGRVYEKHPYWIPETAPLTQYMFSVENPYFSTGKVWVMSNESTRLAGFIAPHQQIDGKLAAYFGYWETLNHTDENQLAFREFEAWAKREGASVVYGPINFSTYGMYRVRIDSFDKPAFIGEPYNPDYYPDLLTGMGYRLAMRYGSSGAESLDESVDKNANFIDSLEEELLKSYRIRLVTERYWMENISKLYVLADEIFKENFAYTPITEEIFKKICGESFFKKLCAHSSVVAETKAGDIAGMMLNFPDYAPLVQLGAESPISQEQVDFNQCFDLLPKPKTLLLKTAAVTPAHRGKHLYTYLFLKSTQNALPYYDSSLACLFSLDNPSKKAVDRIGDGLRQYGLYSKEL